MALKEWLARFDLSQLGSARQFFECQFGLQGCPAVGVLPHAEQRNRASAGRIRGSSPCLLFAYSRLAIGRDPGIQRIVAAPQDIEEPDGRPPQRVKGPVAAANEVDGHVALREAVPERASQGLSP